MCESKDAARAFGVFRRPSLLTALSDDCPIHEKEVNIGEKRNVFKKLSVSGCLAYVAHRL
jgi:hypothetical protein